MNAKVYAYVPALARQELLQMHKDPDDKIKQDLADRAIAETTQQLIHAQGAELLDCGRAMRWVELAGRAEKLLGSEKANLLAKVAGKPVVAPPTPVRTLKGQPVKPQYCVVRRLVAVPLPTVEDDTTGALKGVQDQDDLYLVGHGMPGGGSMGAKCAAGQRCNNAACTIDDDHHVVHLSIDPEGLAALLTEEGLPPTHGKIVLAMCFGAGYADSDLQTVQPFAQRLAAALLARGYKSIRVEGAHGYMQAQLQVAASHDRLKDNEVKFPVEEGWSRAGTNMHAFVGKR